VATACTTGAHAIGDATRFIQYGDADVMLAGGAESCIHPLAMAGFSRFLPTVQLTDFRVMALTKKWNDEPAKASRPFDDKRSGFVIAEGAGLVVLEELSRAQKRNAKIYAEVIGYGLSSDAHHMTAPPENGQGAYSSMKRALKNANAGPQDVAYINAHATSTPLGDRAENIAIRRLMCEDGKVDPKDVRVSSSKGAIGHLLGAAGSVEAIFTVLGLFHVPPKLQQNTYRREFFLQRSISRVIQTRRRNGIVIILSTKLERSTWRRKGGQWR
jgi:3-oxoacyl-[acyl-carrier-protein] synthase II